jgi:hypothetical protein
MWWVCFERVAVVFNVRRSLMIAIRSGGEAGLVPMRPFRYLQWLQSLDEHNQALQVQHLV